MGNSKKQKINYIAVLQWLPVYTTLLILPLIRYYKKFASRLYGYPFYTSDTTNTDVDLYYKQMVFSCIAGLVLLLLICLIVKNRKEFLENLKTRKQWFILIPLGVYLLLALVSSVCSEHRFAAFFGSDTQFESFFVVAGYVLVLCYLVCLIKGERELKYAGIALGISMAELALLGILQYSGHDLMNYTWYQKLITPAGYLESGNELVNRAAEHVVTLNAFNTNYAGVLLAVLSALCLGVLLTEKKFSRMIVEVILLLALITCQIGTGSRAGLLVLAVTAVLALAFMMKRLMKYWYVVIPAVTFVVLSASLFIQYLDLPIASRIESALSVEKTAENPIERMVTVENGVEITYRNTYFKARLLLASDGMEVVVLDEKGKRMPLTLVEEEGYYQIENDALSEIIIAPRLVDAETPAMVITMEGRDWVFVPTTKGYFYINQYVQLDVLEETNRIGFAGYERLASGRGLIWSQTLPLLFERILIGEGANCFVFAYPNNNYKDSYYYTGDATVVTRPHSMYLKIGVESGLLSLIAIVVFWAWYLLQSVPLYVRSRFGTWTERIGFSCFLAVFVYLVCGLSNDSMITVAPTFWCILGVGLAANRLVKEVQKESGMASEKGTAVAEESRAETK